MGDALPFGCLNVVGLGSVLVVVSFNDNVAMATLFCMGSPHQLVADRANHCDAPLGELPGEFFEQRGGRQGADVRTIPGAGASALGAFSLCSGCGTRGAIVRGFLWSDRHNESEGMLRGALQYA